MPVQTFNPSDLSQGAANWAVAQRVVGPFAPHAQSAPGMRIVLDPGHLLSGTTLTEVDTQVVGPFTAPASGFRVDRVVVDRATGAASIVTGAANSLTPPAIPTGKLPVARLFLDNTTAAITNDLIVDERALTDLTQPLPVALCRVDRNGTNQSIPSGVDTLVQFNHVRESAGLAFDTTNARFQPTVAGYYRVYVQGAMDAAIANASFLMAIRRNGSYRAHTSAYATTGYVMSATTEDIVQLNGTTDYLDVYCYHTNGVASNLRCDPAMTFFTAQRIG